MVRYQINDLEQLTGIKAHTIRIWEKRYQLINPHRTNTNIRYYDDDQAKRLMNVATLVNFGHKISRIAGMPTPQLNEMVEKLKSAPTDDVVNASFVTGLLTSMISFDEAAFEKMISAAVTRYGMYGAMVNVIYPFLVKVGILWNVNESMPSQEHFATGIIRRKLMAATDGLPTPQNKEKTVLLFLPPDEWHEIGLLLSEYLVRSAGCNTIYLGQNVPFSNIREMLPHVKPSHLVTFFIMRKKKVDLPVEFTKLSKELGTAKLVVCGRAEMLSTLTPSPNLDLCSSTEMMVDYLKNL
jgi:hypothetical protein